MFVVFHQQEQLLWFHNLSILTEMQYTLEDIRVVLKTVNPAFAGIPFSCGLGDSCMCYALKQTQE